MRLSCLFCLLAALSPAPFIKAQPPSGRPSPWSVGVFAMYDNQPYVGAGENVRAFPHISYNGERLQWNGPVISYTWLSADAWTVGTHATLQFAPYEEDDAPALNGLGDRSDTAVAGLHASWTFLPAWELLLSVDGEIFGAYDGLQAQLGVARRFGSPRNPLSATLEAGAVLQDENWTRYFVGVPDALGRPGRPAFEPGESIHPYVSGQLLFRYDRHWSVFSMVRIEFMDDTWRDSPLIEDDVRLLFFTSLAYTF